MELGNCLEVRVFLLIIVLEPEFRIDTTGCSCLTFEVDVSKRHFVLVRGIFRWLEVTTSSLVEELEVLSQSQTQVLLRVFFLCVRIATPFLLVLFFLCILIVTSFLLLLSF